MAVLKAPARLVASDWSAITVDLEARLRGFLAWIRHALLTAETSVDIGIHGSATTQTIACVQVDAQSTYVVSDIDAVFRTSSVDAAQIVEKLQNRYIEVVGRASQSPGARVSSLVLETLSTGVPEASGLLASALSRGLYCSKMNDSSSVPSLSAMEPRELAPRDVRFAFPYALLRFHEWHRMGPSGYAAAVYEIAKGIDRTLHGDSDVRLGSPCIYGLRSLESLSAEQLYLAATVSLGEEFAKQHRVFFEVLQLVFLTHNGVAHSSALALDATKVLTDIANIWPTSILSARIWKSL